ncbi:hypothetical protein [Pragia fontium]|uniref:hypothetical protein n=1 Tax=Pragia fontium TaxID=82985 RepID=UPI00064930D1|nr:hypothetical protein [Pragia fontium]AKJ41521.1 hypothetical protein QQ39_05025 [Pragia fontium]
MSEHIFTDSTIKYSPKDVEYLISNALEQKYGVQFDVFIHDISHGEYSDDLSVQVICRATGESEC